MLVAGKHGKIHVPFLYQKNIREKTSKKANFALHGFLLVLFFELFGHRKKKIGKFLLISIFPNAGPVFRHTTSSHQRQMVSGCLDIVLGILVILWMRGEPRLGLVRILGNQLKLKLKLNLC